MVLVVRLTEMFIIVGSVILRFHCSCRMYFLATMCGRDVPAPLKALLYKNPIKKVLLLYKQQYCIESHSHKEVVCRHVCLP